LLEEKAIGVVVGVEGNLSRPVGLQPGLPPWKEDPATCPLLPMTQLGIHFVDTVAFLLSPVRSVACVAASMAMPENVQDSTAAILQLESGVPFALCSSYVSPETYVVRIFGTNGAMTCHATHLRLEVMEPANVVEEDFSQEGAESYILQMHEFGECIANNRQPETGGREGLHALAVIEAMALSAAHGNIVQMRDMM
jgi:predicted dehydrogenase